MMGILLAFRKLALSAELDVLQAVGQSYGRLLRVPYLYAIALALVNLSIVGYAQPYARYAYERLQFDLRSGALGASIKVGEFTPLGKRMTVRIERSENEGHDLHGIFVRAESANGQSLAVTADRGTFMATDDPDTILFRLTNGVMVNDAPKFKSPRVSSFSNYDLPINLPTITGFRARGKAHRELSITGLLQVSADPRTPPQLRREARANFHFRLVEVAMMLLLPMGAVAFAVPPKRSSSALGVFLSIIFIVVYHKINEYAEGLAALGQINAVVALWTPFILFAGLMVWMYHVIAHRPGGQPISALERVFAQFSKWFMRLFRFGRRQLGVDIG
jgi:lipopolysaccharide export system permease protein